MNLNIAQKYCAFFFCILFIPRMALCQGKQLCQMKFDFGYGEENYCDSSLIKECYFFYSGLNIGHSINEIKWIDNIYVDSEIEMKIQSTNVYLRRKKTKGIQYFNLLKLYESDCSKGGYFTNKLLISNGYKFELNGQKYYLFFIRPGIGSTSIVRYKCIIFDLSSSKVKVVPLPGFQSSNSSLCFGQIRGSEDIYYVSFNVFIQPMPSVSLYKYLDGQFIKETKYCLNLIPATDAPLYKVDWTNSNWPIADLYCR